MWPLEFTATPGTSPKFMPSGSFGKSGTESKAISGAVCWASAGPASNAKHAIMNAFIGFLPRRRVTASWVVVPRAVDAVHARTRSAAADRPSLSKGVCSLPLCSVIAGPGPAIHLHAKNDGPAGQAAGDDETVDHPSEIGALRIIWR